MTPTIEVLVASDGKTTIHTQGFTGPACQQATKALGAALGLKQAESLTAEYHQTTLQETVVAARPNTPA